MKPITSYIVKVVLIFCVITTFFSCKKGIEQPSVSAPEEFAKQPNDPGFSSNEMVMFWNEKAAAVLGAPMIQPTRTRLFAIVQIAVHDALNNIKPKYERFALNDREQFADPDAAVASAAHRALTGIGRGSAQLDYWRDSCLRIIPNGTRKTLGTALGIRAADAIISNRTNDGFAQILPMPTSPVDGDEPGEYRSPITIVNGNFIYLQPALKYVPNWGTVMKPYVIQSNQQFRPTGPYSVNSSSYTADYNEVKLKGARVGSTRTEAETMKARFWSENRPSITWNNLTREAIKTKKLDAWKTARLFALVHTSLAESIASALNASYHFYFWRPETGIRLAATDNNNNTVADEGWLPFITEVPNRFPTPPQPGYPSTFASYGGSTAEVLRLFFASDETEVNMTSANLPGTTLHFTSFAELARENSLSVMYTGWEFRKSALDGEEMGRQIARYVFNNQFREE